jgi:G3E family GTPase
VTQATLATLVSGAFPSVREAAIAGLVDPAESTAVILEGMPDGMSRLDEITALPTVHIARIAPGCMCCSGNLTMRVTLDRILRRRPTRLFISLASAGHLDEIRRFLHAAPYDQLLQLTDDLQL